MKVDTFINFQSLIFAGALPFFVVAQLAAIVIAVPAKNDRRSILNLSIASFSHAGPPGRAFTPITLVPHRHTSPDAAVHRYGTHNA